MKIKRRRPAVEKGRKEEKRYSYFRRKIARLRKGERIQSGLSRFPEKKRYQKEAQSKEEEKRRSATMEGETPNSARGGKGRTDEPRFA